MLDDSDFRSLFEALPGLFIVVRADAPRFTIAAATDAYLAATMTTRDGPAGIIGRGLFEAFPDPPSEPAATGVHNVRSSIERAIATGLPDVIPVQHYAVRRPDGTWEERDWSPLHSPVADRITGEVTHVIQRVDDVTEAIRLTSEHETLRSEHAVSEQARHAAEHANASLTRQGEALTRTIRHLRELAAHQEIQAEALRRSDGKYRSLFDSIDQGFFVAEMLYDADGAPIDYRYLEANSAFMTQSGLSEPVGKTARELLPQIEESWIATLGRVAATGEPTRFENAVEGLGRWFDVFAFRVGAPGDRRVAMLFGDITSRRLMERERERLVSELVVERDESDRARAEAESANRAKSDFLAMMSHELRTPLNAIGGYAELIDMGLHGPVTPEQRTALDRIQRSQRALLSLINEVLNFARLETGAVTYHLTDVPVAEVVAEAEVLVAPQLREKGLGYSWAGCDLRLAVRADREKLQQVLLNLLSNAIKFTDARAGVPGRIEVSCAPRPADGRVLICVRDSGMGIPPDKAEAVFEPFVQVDQRLKRAHMGTGLGLSISRDLTRGMEGNLTVESIPGVGSTFTITLPGGLLPR